MAGDPDALTFFAAWVPSVILVILLAGWGCARVRDCVAATMIAYDQYVGARSEKPVIVCTNEDSGSR